MKQLVAKKNHLGKGIFTTEKINSKEIIIEFKGELIERKNVPHILTPEDDRYIQIEKNLYMGPSNELDDLINHSCNPNAGIKIIENHVFLIAIRNIKKGEEITWDYSTTMDEDEWEMSCKCENINCRKIIRDFKYLPRKIQEKYMRLQIVPSYILKDLKNNPE